MDHPVPLLAARPLNFCRSGCPEVPNFYRSGCPKLRQAARRDGVSLAEAIRRLVDRGLADETDERARLYARAAEAVGRYRARRGAKDIAVEHDNYLDEAFD